MTIKLTKREQVQYDQCLGQCSGCMIKADCELQVKLKDLRTVTLIPEGYMWLCPDCQWQNVIYEVTTTVKCFNCNTEFQVKE